MLKSSLKNPALRKRASQFTRLVRHSVVTPRTGKTHKPQLVSNGELGVTFIGHSSFFLQIGGQNVIIDPNFARLALRSQTPAPAGIKPARSACRGCCPGNARALRSPASPVAAHHRAANAPSNRDRSHARHPSSFIRPGRRSRLRTNCRTRMVEHLSPRRARRHSRPLTPLGSAHAQRFAPRLWRLCAARRQTLRLPRRRHRLLRRLPRDRTPLIA